MPFETTEERRRKFRYGACLSCGKHRQLREDSHCTPCGNLADSRHKRTQEAKRMNKPQRDAAAGREALRALNAVIRANRKPLQNSH